MRKTKKNNKKKRRGGQKNFLNLKMKELNRLLYADKTTPVPWDENVEIKKELENTYRELDA